jgi:hypothetical protein
MPRDTYRALYHAGTMDEQAIRRAALVTLSRAIFETFPPGRERQAWLTWLAKVHEQGSGHSLSHVAGCSSLRTDGAKD